MPPNTLTITPVLPVGPGVTFGLIGTAKFVASGTGDGWQKIARARQTSLTYWSGAAPMTLGFDLILDGGHAGASIEELVTRVEGWQYPTLGARQPPIFRVTGPIPAAAKAMYWGLESLDLDLDRVIRNQRGDATQELLTIGLLQYVPGTASVLTNLSPAQAAQLSLAASGVSTGRRNYIVKSGDTLAKIAARVLGSAALWPTLATLNGIRDPSNLRAGQAIVLPS